MTLTRPSTSRTCREQRTRRGEGGGKSVAGASSLRSGGAKRWEVGRKWGAVWGLHARAASGGGGRTGSETWTGPCPAS